MNTYKIEYLTNIEVEIAKYFKPEMFESDSFAYKFFSEQCFFEGDTFTDKQRLAFWNIVIQNRQILPPDKYELVEQIGLILQAQSKSISTDVNHLLSNLNYKLKLPFQITEWKEQS